MNVIDITSAIILGLISALAASSGTGGGGLLVALFISMEHFAAREAMPLSKASILGGAIANFFYNMLQRHPGADRPLIDYDIVGIMEPCVLLGTVVGVYAIKLLPSWLVLALLVVVLSYTAYKTVLKGWSIHKDEQAAIQELDASLVEINDLEDGEVPVDSAKRLINPTGSINSTNDPHFRESITDVVGAEWQLSHREEIAEIKEEESKTPWFKILSFVFIWACVFVVSFLKGGEGHDSLIGIPCGSLYYWLLVCSMIPAFILYTAVFGYFLNRRYQRKKEIEYPFLRTDIEWTGGILIKLPIFGFFAGIAAGLFGIGSGMIVGPIILSYQVPPRVVAAVSAFMILFTASSTTIQFSVFGLLKYDYALWYSGFGFVGAMVGQFGIGYIMKKYKKDSLVAFILAFMIIGGAIGLTVIGIINIIHKAENGADLWALSPLCPNETESGGTIDFNVTQ